MIKFRLSFLDTGDNFLEQGDEIGHEKFSVGNQ